MTQEVNTGYDLLPKVRVEGDAAVGAVQGEVDLHNSPDFRVVLLDIIAQYAPRRLILNFATVPYIDSSAIAVMVEALQKLRKSKGRIYLTDLRPRVRGLLEIARLESIFILCATEKDAMEQE